MKSLEITFYKTFFLALLATIFTIEVSVAQWQTKVDSLVQDAIAQKAFPGAQVLVAHKGEIVLERAYGFHTYDSLIPVQNTDLYDLASVTKILGPLPAIMSLVEQGVLDLDVPFSTYWTPWKKYRDKKDLTLREILAHQAGLTPYIVFLNEVLRSNKHRGPQLKKRFVRRIPPSVFHYNLMKTGTFTGIFPVKCFARSIDLKYLKKRPTPTQAFLF